MRAIWSDFKQTWQTRRFEGGKEEEWWPLLWSPRLWAIYPPRSPRPPRLEKFENDLIVSLVENLGEARRVVFWCESRASWLRRWLYTWGGVRGTTLVVMEVMDLPYSFIKIKKIVFYFRGSTSWHVFFY